MNSCVVRNLQWLCGQDILKEVHGGLTMLQFVLATIYIASAATALVKTLKSGVTSIFIDLIQVSRSIPGVFVGIILCLSNTGIIALTHVIESSALEI